MAETQTIFEYLKQGGLLSLAVLLAVLAKKLLDKVFEMYERRLKEKDEVVSEVRADLEKVKSQRDMARDQVLAEKERYHRLATEVAGMAKETGGWLEYLARAEGSGRRGGSRPPPAVARHRPRAEEDEGGAGT